MDRKSKYFFKKCVSFSEIELAQDQSTTVVQILRTGSWDHPIYGQFKVDLVDLMQFVQNFKNNVRGVDLCVDVNHHHEHRAVGWFRNVYQEGEALFALIEWTAEGKELLTSKQYRYFSPELYFSFRDEETGEVLNNVLIGGGITNRPFFKGMKALQMSEPETAIENEARKTFYFYNLSDMSKKFSDIVAELANVSKVTPAQLDEARLSFSQLSTAEQDASIASMSAIEAKFTEEVEEEAPADETPKTEENKEGEGDGGEGEGEGEGENPNPETADPVKANEDGADVNAQIFKETGMTMDEIKAMQKSFSEMAQKQKLADLEKQVEAHVFSEKNQKGRILPKAKPAVVTFASKLPENLVKEFFELVSGQNFAGKSVEFGEKGSNESLAFNIPANVPNGVDRESYILANIAQQFKEKDASLSLEGATLKAHEYITKNGIK